METWQNCDSDAMHFNSTEKLGGNGIFSAVKVNFHFGIQANILLNTEIYCSTNSKTPNVLWILLQPVEHIGCFIIKHPLWWYDKSVIGFMFKCLPAESIVRFLNHSLIFVPSSSSSRHNTIKKRIGQKWFKVRKGRGFLFGTVCMMSDKK